MTTPFETGQIEESRLASVEMREGSVDGVAYRLFLHTLEVGLTFALDLDPTHIPRVGTKILYEWEPESGRAVIYYPYEWTPLGTPLCRVVTFRDGDRLFWRSPKPYKEAIMATSDTSNGNQKEVPAWLQKYEPKEQVQIRAASQYARHFSEAGFPGHFLLLLIAKMAADLHGRAAGGKAPEPANPPKTQPKPDDRPLPGADDGVDEFERIPAAGDGAATEKQIKAIYAIGRAQLRLGEREVDDLTAETFGVVPSGLTKGEASQMMDILKSRGAVGR
jgi:hypothetical protein